MISGHKRQLGGALRCAILLFALLMGPMPVRGAVGMRGQQYYVICAACHGERAEGIEALGAPRLSQLPVSYLVRQLENFRHGRRGSHADDSFGQQMALVAAMIPDEDVERS